MSMMKMLWAIIILLRSHTILCFTSSLSHHSAVNVHPLSETAAADSNSINVIPGNVAFQSHDIEENERPIYDPGDEFLRALNSKESNELMENVIDELDLTDKYELLKKLENDIREEQQVVMKSSLLMQLLEDPSIDTLPLVYVEEPVFEIDSNGFDSPELITGLEKRSRYYRRYPWKRHSRNRGTYEPEIRYACTPSKEDVFKLLISLHENRNGNHQKTVNFCNRKRPAKKVFTNIRFIG